MQLTEIVNRQMKIEQKIAEYNTSWIFLLSGKVSGIIPEMKRLAINITCSIFYVPISDG